MPEDRSGTETQTSLGGSLKAHIFHLLDSDLVGIQTTGCAFAKNAVTFPPKTTFVEAANETVMIPATVLGVGARAA